MNRIVEIKKEIESIEKFQNDIFRFHFEVLSKYSFGVKYFFINSLKLIRFAIQKDNSLIDKTPIENKIIGIVSTKNNLQALLFLQNKNINITFVGINNVLKKENTPGHSLTAAINFKCLFVFCKIYITLIYKYRKKALFQPDVIFKSVLLYYTTYKLFLNKPPKAIVFSNDHTPAIRSIINVAKQLSIPTIYLQHASVAANFPPLIFNLSLLEGQDSLNKYKKCGIDGNVKLIGMPKADKYLYNRKFNNILKTIGVGISVQDDMQSVNSLLQMLHTKFSDYQLLFRQHPRDKRKFNLPMSFKQSHPNKESSFDFLLNCNVLIAGVTSMHLEAVMLNIPSLYYDLEGFYYDYYGYAINQLCYTCKELKDVELIVNSFKEKIPNVYTKAIYYNSTIGSKLEGHSEELAIREISDYLTSYYKDFDKLAT